MYAQESARSHCTNFLVVCPFVAKYTGKDGFPFFLGFEAAGHKYLAWSSHMYPVISQNSGPVAYDSSSGNRGT